MVTRIVRPALALSVIFALFAGTAQGATTPKPTSTSTTKPTVKATTKPTVKATTKPAATKKPVVKKKAVVRKPIVQRKSATLKPTPKPVWPPKGFRVNGEIYARVPTASELLAILSTDKKLTAVAKQCITKACGVVRLASTKGCTWWEILSTVRGPASTTDATTIVRGNLRTTAASTQPKQVVTVYLISSEPLTPKTSLGGLSISCYHSPVAEKIPSNSYVPTVKATPSESPTPTATESPSAEPSPTATSG
ncbi:MAG: hypothetical protein NTX12_02925 [Actinobacteria bacterium]|nr:hypothetical protein [Actinomycetota bacterium]